MQDDHDLRFLEAWRQMFAELGGTAPGHGNFARVLSELERLWRSFYERPAWSPARRA